MRNYLLLFLSFMLLLFALPKQSSLRSYAQQGERKEAAGCKNPFGKKTCLRKCLRHQTHSERHNSAAAGSIASDCGQQLYAIVDVLQPAGATSFAGNRKFILPLTRKHLSPDLELEPEPPRFSGQQAKYKV